jgi:glycosyltransferase involved in cell wall biosynthesis
VKLIFINRFFHPDHSATSQLLSDLAFALARRGHSVAVVTSRQRYDAPGETLPPRESIGGVAVHRIWTSRFGRANLAGRAIDYATFYLSAAWRLWRLARAGDVVIAKTDPPMLSAVVGPLCRWRRARLVNWLQDIFPETAEALGVGGRAGQALFRLLRGQRNRSLRAAHMNVVLGRRMAGRVLDLGVPDERMSIVPNWADGGNIVPVEPGANALRAAWQLEDAFVVGYSGNLGRAHEIDTLVQAMAILEAQETRAAQGAAVPEQEPAAAHQNGAGHGKREWGAGSGEWVLRAPHPPLPIPHSTLPSDHDGPSGRPVRWLFIGSGALLDALKAEVARRGLASVRFKPYQAQARLAESLSAADVHLVSLRPALEGLIVPSKLYGIAAAGRPTVFVGDADGEIASAIAQHACGVTVAMGDGPALARTIAGLAAEPDACRRMGQRARAAFEAEFDKPMALERWEKLLLEVAGGCSQSPRP